MYIFISIVKRHIKDDLNSTFLEQHAEISIIEAPETKKNEKPTTSKDQIGKSPMSVKKATNSKKIENASAKESLDIQPSLSVVNKRRPLSTVNESSVIGKRPQRSVNRKKIIYSSDESDHNENVSPNKSGNASDWTESVNSSNSFLTDDDDSDFETNIATPRSRSNKKCSVTVKRVAKKDINRLIYLDLSAEEVAETDEHFQTKACEEDLANITKQFLETDLENEDPYVFVVVNILILCS